MTDHHKNNYYKTYNDNVYCTFQILIEVRKRLKYHKYLDLVYHKILEPGKFLIINFLIFVLQKVNYSS